MPVVNSFDEFINLVESKEYSIEIANEELDAMLKKLYSARNPLRLAVTAGCLFIPVAGWAIAGALNFSHIKDLVQSKALKNKINKDFVENKLLKIYKYASNERKLYRKKL